MHTILLCSVCLSYSICFFKDRINQKDVKMCPLCDSNTGPLAYKASAITSLLRGLENHKNFEVIMGKNDQIIFLILNKLLDGSYTGTHRGCFNFG